MKRYFAAIGVLAAAGLGAGAAPATPQGDAPQRIGYFAEAPLPDGGIPVTQLPPAARQQLSPQPSKVRTDTPRG
ncbi:hypothetical protein [Kitasatospora sp. NPDC059827]|uniref:hypothetical protein n=1 Tax=Kitasatospora sp. NPDC059827 TaxID=3346964 RepID=UPI00364FFAED